MRLHEDEHHRHDWWVHGYAHDFELLDVWQYPIEAEREEDFEAFLEIHDLAAMVSEASVVVRGLFAVRKLLGRIFGWDAEGVGFEEVYRDRRELVLRIENATVTALLHLGWVQLDPGSWTAQLSVYAIPKGRLGRFYMALISPFRHHLVYPALMRAGRRRWERRRRNSPC